jgi:hypothetical protein
MDGLSDFLAGLGIGIKKAMLLAGAIGTVLGIVVRRQFHWFEALTAAASGCSCVLFLAPYLVRFFGADGDKAVENLVAFGAGLFGMYAVDFAFSIARNPWAAYRRWKNGGSDGGAP